MKDDEYSELKSMFLTLVAAVPLPLRKEIIAVVDGSTLNWDVAAEEIKRDGPKAKMIIKQLKKVGLL